VRIPHLKHNYTTTITGSNEKKLKQFMLDEEINILKD
jgi:hypothetical protein